MRGPAVSPGVHGRGAWRVHSPLLTRQPGLAYVAADVALRDASISTEARLRRSGGDDERAGQKTTPRPSPRSWASCGPGTCSDRGAVGQPRGLLLVAGI
jgi:hypothetical protein